MKHYVIASAGSYWSLYGWAPLANALRFSSAEDAAGFRDGHGLGEAAIEPVSFDDDRRPDIATDYNPFSL